MLKKASFARKLQLFALMIVGCATIAMILILRVTEQRIHQDRLSKVRSVVEAAWSVARYYADEENAGRLSRDSAQTRAKAALRALRYDENEYFWINDTIPAMVMHPIKPEMNGTSLRDTRDPTGKPFFVAMVDTARRSRAGGFVDYAWPKPGASKPVPKISFVKALPQWGWIVGSGVYIDDVRAEILRARIRLAIFMLVGIGVAFGLAQLISRRLTKPVVAAREVARQAAAGDLTARVAVTSGDELGDVATAMNQMLESFCSTVREVRTSCDRTTMVAREVATAADAIAAGAQHQAASLEESAASLEEITATVKQSAEHAAHASRRAREVAGTADQGGAVVGRAVKAVTDLNHASHRIGEIITTIDEIAFQTNLLALNAAVEAARAGAQGRGFAVVASEVRALAQRSGNAAKEIRTLIQDSIGRAELGTELVSASGAAFSEITTGVKGVTEIVEEITVASREQSVGVEQASEAVSQMDRVVQANAAQTEELAGSAQTLSRQAEQLQAMVARFKVEEERSSWSAEDSFAESIPGVTAGAFGVELGRGGRFTQPREAVLV